MKKTGVLVFLFSSLLAMGIFKHEFPLIYQHAVMLCLSCIGIG